MGQDRCRSPCSLHASKRQPVRATAAMHGRWAVQRDRQQGPSGGAVAATAVQAQANKERGYASVAERVSKASVQVAGVGRK